jgi:hypothetical protein
MPQPEPCRHAHACPAASQHVSRQCRNSMQYGPGSTAYCPHPAPLQGRPQRTHLSTTDTPSCELLTPAPAPGQPASVAMGHAYDQATGPAKFKAGPSTILCVQELRCNCSRRHIAAVLEWRRAVVMLRLRLISVVPPLLKLPIISGQSLQADPTWDGTLRLASLYPQRASCLLGYVRNCNALTTAFV